MYNDMTSTKRDNYIDILRGILMILVVMVHIDTYLIMPKINLEFNIILTKIRMPLFFLSADFSHIAKTIILIYSQTDYSTE